MRLSRLSRLSLPFLALMLAWVMPSAVEEADAAFCVPRTRCAALSSGKSGGGPSPPGSCSNKLDLTQTCNDVLFFTIGR